MAAISGFGGTVIVGVYGTTPSTALPVGDWTVTIRGEFIDASTFEHGMMHDYKVLGREYEVTFNAFWVNEQDPLTNLAGGSNLTPGGFAATQLVTQKVYLILRFCRGNFRGFEFTHFLIENVSVTTGTRDVVKYSITGRATGEITFTSADAQAVGTPVYLPGSNNTRNSPSQRETG